MIKHKLLKVLRFLSLLNDDDNVSLTNVSLIVLVGALIMGVKFDEAGAATLVGAFALYGHKHYCNHKENMKDKDIKAASDTTLDEIQKTVEDNKTIVDQLSKKVEGVIQSVNINARPNRSV
jgi:hypothetical protein